MKRNLVIFILIGLPAISLTQVDTIPLKKNPLLYGVNVGPNISFATIFLNRPDYEYQFSKNFNYHTYLTVEKNNHLIAFGASFGPQLELNFHNSSYPVVQQNNKVPKLNGYHLIYQKKLKSKSNWFEHFYKIQFNHLNYRFKGTHTWFDEFGTWENQSVPYTYKENILEGLLGYGVQFNLTHQFYISQAVGLGFLYDHSTIYFGETNGTALLQKDGKSEGGFLNASLNLNLGFRFNK